MLTNRSRHIPAALDFEGPPNDMQATRSHAPINIGACERSGSRVRIEFDFPQKPATSLFATLLLTARNSAIAGFRSPEPMLWRIVRLAFKAASSSAMVRFPLFGHAAGSRLSSLPLCCRPHSNVGSRDAGEPSKYLMASERERFRAARARGEERHIEEAGLLRAPRLSLLGNAA